MVFFPEINLEPRDNVYGKQRYESGLIRVAFVRGNPPFAKRLYGGPVLTDAEPYRTFLLKEHHGIDNWNKDFHNYSMIWKPSTSHSYPFVRYEPLSVEIPYGLMFLEAIEL